MKKFVVVIMLILVAGFTFAQEKETVDLEKQNWFHQDFEKTGVYGVGTLSALEFVKSKKLKPKPIIVAVIDSGIEIDHEDLKDNIWVNKGEKPGNGKDDDGNGYIDDIHGWDYLGNAKGEDINQDTYEFVRVFDMYNPIFNSSDMEKNRKNAMEMPKKYQTYLQARYEYFENLKEQLGRKDNFEQEKMQAKEISMMLASLDTFFKGKTLTADNIMNLTPATMEEEQMAGQIKYIFENNPDFEGKTFKEIQAEYEEETKDMEKKINDYLNYYYNRDFDTRKVIGDNYDNLKEINYGNNEVEGPDALHGTHVAGIIAAVRNNKKGMDGIAGDVAKIMVLRAVPDGDERDKDVANAIRYAVDNGAKIINMSFGKAYSPFKDEVWEAMKYASSKGVLMFHAAGNDNKDLDYLPNYPTNFEEDEYKSFVENWITVGASTRYNDKLKASFSNYGMMRVDLFSPGLEIYAPVIDNKYRYLQGTSMASPAAAGCAALLWSYFPNLQASEVKDILMKTVNVADEKIEVGKGIETKFNKISLTGGVIDVNKAIQYAYKNYK